MYYACGPRLHEYLQGVGKVLTEYNAFSVGEMPCVGDPKEIIKAVAYDRKELNMIFHFEMFVSLPLTLFSTSFFGIFLFTPHLILPHAE